MKNFLLPLFLIFVFVGTSAQHKPDNPFYAFSNAGNLPNAPEGLDAKASLFKDLGYDGWGGHYGEEDYMARRAALDKASLTMPELYWGMNIDSSGKASYKEGLREAIADSKDRDLIVSLLVSAKAYQENQAEGDPYVVEAIRELADYAAPFGVRIAVYPHVNVYCETLEHSLRLASLAQRENVGAIFNLCHLLKKEGEEGWEKKLSEAIPHLYMISLCGSDSGNTTELGWDRLIQPLGEGSFDTYALVKLAWDQGYEGPFGLQCYNIQLDAEKVLSQSIQTWRKYQELYQKAQNTAEDSDFQALFDGRTTKGWRGMNSDRFPGKGWQIVNGVLKVNAQREEGAEPGGDIITLEMYGDFEFRWEWLMLSKGGNSGVKYYVEEKGDDNSLYGIGPEYQILDDPNHEWMLNGKMSPCDYHTLGSLYEIYPASCDKKPVPLGQWNRSRIISKNGEVEHWLNGKLILSYNRFSEDFKQKISESKFRDYSDFGQIEKGHILIQDHGSEVHYRNMLIRTL